MRYGAAGRWATRYGPEGRDRRRVVWGMLLVAIGVVLLMGQLGAVGILPPWHWWPGILLAIGVVQMLVPESPRQFASGVAMILLGLWFFACIEHWYGLQYRNAWPLLLVIFGGEMVLGSVLQRIEAGRKESEEHHA